MKIPLILGLIVLSSLALASCTNTKTTTDTATPTPVATTPTPTPEKIPTMEGTDHGGINMNTMTGEMAHMGASTEEEFIANMIPHHQEAVDTASIIVAKTQNAELKKIAENIVSAQKAEITLLNSWMKSWYPNSTLKVGYIQMMRDLSKLSDHDLDDAFMEDMIKHHEWAVHMAEEVLEVSQRPEIVKMANDIIRTQNAEIAIFKKLLGNH